MKARNLSLALLALIAIGTFTFSQTAGAQGREPGGVATVGAVATATVKAIDPEKRTVTLENADGETSTIKCGTDVRNFDQIKVGDQVKAAAVEQLAVSVGKAGAAAPDASDGAVVARAPKGDKPGLIIATTENVTAKVESVDAENRTVILQGADGLTQRIRVASDVDLSGVKKGDEVTARLTKGLALWVERPQDSAQPAAGAIKPPGVAPVEMENATAIVQAIDAQKRIVTLKNEAGETRKIQLGKEAINFEQIEVGDKVKATLAEEVAIAVSKGGALPDAQEVIVARAPKGSKPNIVIAESAQISSKIKAIDAEKRTITLADVDGKPKTIKVGAKVDLSQLKAGDDVTARVTQALAIVVEKP